MSEGKSPDKTEQPKEFRRQLDLYTSHSTADRQPEPEQESIPPESNKGRQILSTRRKFIGGTLGAFITAIGGQRLIANQTHHQKGEQASTPTVEVAASWTKLASKELMNGDVEPDWSEIGELAKEWELPFLVRDDERGLVDSEKPELDTIKLEYNTDTIYSHESADIVNNSTPKSFVTYRLGKPEYNSEGVSIFDKPGESDDSRLATRVKGEIVNGVNPDWFLPVGGYKNSGTGEIKIFAENPTGNRLGIGERPAFLYHDFVKVVNRRPPPQ